MTKKALLEKGPKNSGMGRPPPPLIRAMPERKRFFFQLMSSLIGLQLWSSRWHYFHKSTEQGGVGGESEKTPCSMNVQKFSTVFWLAKELCCKGWPCFVPCLTFPHNQTISAFLYLYNPIQRLPFTLLQPLFLSLTKISPLAGKGTDR